MKKQLNYAAQCAAGLLALGTVAVSAQTIQQVEIKGTVDSWYNHYTYEVPAELQSAETFKFVVEQDISAALYNEYTSSSYEYQQFQNNLYRLTYTFYDASGVEIVTPANVALELTAAEMVDSWVYAEQSLTSDYQYIQWWASGIDSESNQSHQLGGYVWNNGQEPLWAEYKPYPLLLSSTPDYNSFSGWIHHYDQQTNMYLNFYGVVTSIVATGLDEDGDGFADDIDTCQVSLMDETVLLNGWYDSGVTNHVDESGCTVMDHYAACTVEEQEESSTFSWSQPIYSGPSYCEKQVAYGLVSDGVLSYGEARTLRDALYQSYRSVRR